MDIMQNKQKLSLFSLILININIMLGSGIFINTSILAKLAGSISALTYLVVGILLLPLIMAIVKLWNTQQTSCTFYHFGLPISPFFGFLSSWSYFIGKISSAVLSIHVCNSFLQQVIPVLQNISVLALDVLLIFLFTIFNLLNLRTGQSIQYSFLVLKLIPILFAILSGFYLFSGSNFTFDNIIWSGIPAGVPLVLYAFAGFEASCSLSQHVDNPKNGPKAILISYALAIIIAVLFQFLIYASLGQQLGQFSGGYLDVFPALLSKLFNYNSFKNALMAIISIGIASSSLGAAYGILFSNSWNLYTVAQNKHTFLSKNLTSFNKYNIPYVCIIIEGLLALIYLLVTRGQQIPLQQVGALGPIIAYTFSVIALLVINLKKDKKPGLLPVLSLLSCLMLISSFAWSILSSGISILLILFIILLIFGSFMFYRKHEPKDLEIYEKL